VTRKDAIISSCLVFVMGFCSAYGPLSLSFGYVGIALWVSIGAGALCNLAFWTAYFRRLRKERNRRKGAV
jgi:hypothetical protein